MGIVSLDERRVEQSRPIFVNSAAWARFADEAAGLEPCPVKGVVTPDQMRVLLGERLNIWPLSMADGAIVERPATVIPFTKGAKMATEPKRSYSYEQLLSGDASLPVADDAREGRLDEATLDRIQHIARAFEQRPAWLCEFI